MQHSVANKNYYNLEYVPEYVPEYVSSLESRGSGLVNSSGSSLWSELDASWGGDWLNVFSLRDKVLSGERDLPSVSLVESWAGKCLFSCELFTFGENLPAYPGCPTDPFY